MDYLFHPFYSEPRTTYVCYFRCGYAVLDEPIEDCNFTAGPFGSRAEAFEFIDENRRRGKMEMN